MNNQFMKEKPVFPLLLSMALPMVLSMMVNALYNIIDSFFVAQISENAITALSLVFPIQNLINAVAIGFGVGLNAVISINLGAQDEKKADQTAAQGLFLSAVHGIVFTVGCILIIPAFLGAFTADDSVIDLGVRYCRIVFSFTTIIMFGLAFEKIFQAVGSMKVTMLSMLCGCITNIILDPVLIFGLGPFPKLGIEGAALATGIGQTVTLAIYLVIYVMRPIRVKIHAKDLRPNASMIRRLYAIGIPAILNMALPSILISTLNAILAPFSPIYILILGVYYKLQTFLYLPANGIVQGMRPIIGFNYGAGEQGRVRKIYRLVLLMTGSIMLIGMIVCMTIPGTLISLFTDNPETITAGKTALRIISLGFVVSSISVTSSGALEGIGKGVQSLMISLCRYLLIIVPAAFLLSRLIGPTGVWHAFWIAEAAAAVISLIIYRRTASTN